MRMEMPPVRRTLVVAFCASLGLAAFGSVVQANHSWGGYHWARTSNPFTIKLGDNTSGDWVAHLAQASSDWSKSTVLDTVVVPGQAKGRCRPTAGRDEVCNDRYGNNGWLGLAQIWISGGHITQGTVKLNDTYFMNQAEEQHVVCQEVGHTFGLDHQDTSGASLNTCMDYYSNKSDSDTKSTTPNQHDYDELATIYSHLDSTTTIQAATAAERARGFDDESSWGFAVKGSREAGHSVYVRDLGNGNRIFTFVTWADPRRNPSQD